MENIILSIIIPVYNAEMYLKQCLESVINIQEDNIEIIIIDDGSEDNSFTIINDFSIRDNRIKMIKQSNNKGVSATRNTGIDSALGKWITFIDSDDLIDTHTYENVITILRRKADFFVLKTHRFRLDNDIKINCEAELQLDALTNEDLHIIYRGIVEQDYNKYKKFKAQSYDFYGPYAKFFKTQLIKKNNIHFREDISIGEDRLFNLEYFKYVKMAFCIRNYGYFYRQNEQSAMNLYKEGKARLLYNSIKAVKQTYLGEEYSVAQYGIRHYLFSMQIDFCNLNNPKSYSIRKKESMQMRNSALIAECFQKGNILKLRKKAIPIAICAKYNIFWLSNVLLHLKQRLNKSKGVYHDKCHSTCI